MVLLFIIECTTTGAISSLQVRDDIDQLEKTTEWNSEKKKTYLTAGKDEMLTSKIDTYMTHTAIDLE